MEGTIFSILANTNVNSSLLPGGLSDALVSLLFHPGQRKPKEIRFYSYISLMQKNGNALLHVKQGQ